MKLSNCFFGQCVLFLFLISCSQNQEKCDILFQNAHIFDGIIELHEVDIAVRNDTILRIGKKLRNFVSVDTFDLAGKHLIPGMVNSHVHLWRPEDLEACIQLGIFAVLDMHASRRNTAFFSSLRDSIQYASYFYAGLAGTVPNGHPSQYFPMETISDSLSPAQFVINRVEEGADYIKVVSGNLKPGTLWAGRPTLDFDQIKLVVEKAHELDKVVLCHVSQVEEAVEIAKTGVDGLAHLWSYNQTATDEQLSVLQENKMFVVPTLRMHQKAWEQIDRNPGGDHSHKEYLSTMEVFHHELRRLAEYDIPILAGTDPPNFGVNFTTDFFEELNIYSEAGLSNLEVLKTATSNPAQIFGLQGIGTIEEGQKANFTVLNSNPIENLEALKEIHAVWKNGKQVNKSTD